MAKDLPYFKFFCSEWNDGDITLEDFKTQGLFINICSYYWSNECNITFKTLKKKFKHNIEDIEYLVSEGLIKECADDNISISFLDEQLEDRIGTSKKNSLAGKKSAEVRRLKKLEEEMKKDLTENQRALNLGSTETQPLREEEIKEEKKREKKPHKFETKEFKEELWQYLKEYTEDNKLEPKKVIAEATKAYEYYKDLGWKNSNNKKVINLKSTIRNNWLSDLEKFRKEAKDGWLY
jgi:hypothetical protein